MNVFLTYIRDFIKSIDQLLLILVCIFTAVIIFINYRYSIEPKVLNNISNRLYRFAGFYFVYLVAFSIPYILLYFFRPGSITNGKFLWMMVLVAPAIFALKVNFTGIAEYVAAHVPGSWGRFYSIVVNLPSKLLVVLICLAAVWWIGNYEPPFFRHDRQVNTTSNLEGRLTTIE